MSFVLIECGSSARGDFNPESDRDIVCIWNDPKPDFVMLRKEFGEIVFYSEQNIKKMKDKGSLFIAHLGVDGKYILGERTLMTMLRGFKPNNNSIQKNILETETFIRNIEWFPDSNKGLLWLSDVLYVSLRNYIFCKNALKTKYIFGYESALKAFGLAQDEIKLMLQLRNGKYAYRKGAKDSITNLTKETAEIACAKILKTQILFREGGITNWESMNKKSYWTERLVERAILNKEHFDCEFIENLKSHQYNKYAIKKKTIKIIESHTKSQTIKKDD
ncbi:nucleotidyltransferase domain-containing protein [Pseudomonas sp. P115]|uniref:nucleotidyltransferase domain-containing protein n=1 Tax=Pseudomonas pisciculturae TaxID=2730413 RepID=UPI001891F466|nr:nucleotidyltransferase domain-containing protein [Pseudomonas pisciculturae]MBF6031367.1 nucleotidyltransferase domain-containing protein [Pseudomonas pisciculturae]